MPRVKVHIITGNMVTKKKNCKIDGNQVIIKKGDKGRGNIGWKVPFQSTDFKYSKKFLGLFGIKRHLEIKTDARKFIPFGKDPKDVDVPSCTRADVEAYGNAKVITQSGKSTQNVTVPTIVYLLLAGILILQVFQFMTSQGVIINP